jgi:hypothetical protein
MTTRTLPTAWPNCLRSNVYGTALSKAPCARPTICAAMPTRPSFRISIAYLGAEFVHVSVWQAGEEKRPGSGLTCNPCLPRREGSQPES